MSWPTGWREALLRETGIPVTQFALDVLASWCQSTPTEPWTNNPLGLPAKGNSAPQALNTPYALFHTTGRFRKAFTALLETTPGKDLRLVLTHGTSHGQAWRTINGMSLPANVTETDYPSALLDRLTDDYRATLTDVKPDQRKTAGAQLASPKTHDDMRSQQRALHEAVTTFNKGSEAMAHIARRLG
jgi:hypothetical protein